MMDTGYLVIAIFFGLIGLTIWASRARWNGKRDDYKHNPLPGHRQEGSSSSGNDGRD